jgi:hypothetical protein
MWWIWIVSLIEAVGFLLVWGLLLAAAPRSEKELCHEDEAQVRGASQLASQRVPWLGGNRIAQLRIFHVQAAWAAAGYRAAR